MDRTSVRYHVLHETRYEYGSAVSLSQQQLHLSPRVLDWQQVEAQQVDIDPRPAWRRDGQDAFGNPVTWVAFHAPHDKFDPEATTVSTPVMEVLEKKRGVCQDFAHLMIACLRALGRAARYVSGYLLTRPPPGKPRLIGADASHAWVSVYAPGFANDWVDFDPTNNLLLDTEHITVRRHRP